MTHISGQPYSILGDPGVVSRDDAIFSGESLLLDVNFRPKISRLPINYLYPFPWVSEDDYDRMTSSFLLKFKMADGEYCRAMKMLKTAVVILFSLK